MLKADNCAWNLEREMLMDVRGFIKAALPQDENTIRNFLHKDAHMNWHCSNEHFTVYEFIIANCEYPGDWDGTVERVKMIGDLFITVTKVYPRDRSAYFHVVSFIKTANDKIVSMDEYWADDGNPPQWRIDKHIGPQNYINSSWFIRVCLSARRFLYVLKEVICPDLCISCRLHRLFE